MLTNSRTWTKVILIAVFTIIIPTVIINIALLSKNFRALELSAKSILKGKKIIFSNLNDAGSLLPLHVMRNMPYAPVIASIGSSRVMNLHKHIVAQEQPEYLVNYCIAADLTNLEGIINAYLLYAKSLPKHIVLGVDPWLFNVNYQTIFPVFSSLGKIPWLTTPARRQAAYLPVLLTQVTEPVKVFSLEFANTNFKNLTATLFESFDSIPKERTGKAHYDSDGSKYSHQTEAENMPYLIQCIYKMYFQNFMKLDNRDRFEQLLLFLTSQKIQITFYLAPFHPSFIKNLETTKKLHLLVACETFAKDIAQKYTIPTIGSYFPQTYSLEHNDFVDALHVTDKATKKIWDLERHKVTF